MAEGNGETTKKSSEGKGLLIILIVLILILVMTVAGGTYFLLDKISSTASNGQKTKETAQSSTPANTSEATFKADVSDLVLNLADSKGKEKVMKLSFSIRSNGPLVATVIEEYKAEITDVVVSQVSSRSSEELLTVGGKNLLKDELIAEINNVINYVTKSNRNVVSTILFTTFVIK